MRTFVLFALAFAGTAILADDASAFGRRNRGGGGGNCCGGGAPAYSGYSGGGCCGGSAYGAGGYHGAPYVGGAYGGAGYGVASTPCCGGGGMAYQGGYSGGYPGGMIGMTGTAANGRATTIQATDGHTYVLGQDGSYYPANSGFGMQPYNTGGYRSFYGSGIAPAGYYGPYGNVYPAGGTPPLTMPGVNLPGGITIVPTPMPNK